MSSTAGKIKAGLLYSTRETHIVASVSVRQGYCTRKTHIAASVSVRQGYCTREAHIAASVSVRQGCCTRKNHIAASVSVWLLLGPWCECGWCACAHVVVAAAAGVAGAFIYLVAAAALVLPCWHMTCASWYDRCLQAPNLAASIFVTTCASSGCPGMGLPAPWASAYLALLVGPRAHGWGSFACKD